MLDDLAARYRAAWMGSCREEGCGLVMGDVGRYSIFKGEALRDLLTDTPVAPGKMCDCVIFLEGKRIVLVEIKGGSTRASSVEEKLTNAARLSLKIAGEYGRGFEVFFVILRCRRSKGTASALLRGCRPRVYGARRDPAFGGNRSLMADLLHKHGPGALPG